LTNLAGPIASPRRAAVSAVGLKTHSAAVGHGAAALHRRLPSAVRRPLTLVVGLILLLASVIMLVLPGPGLLTVWLGLAVLALEFSQARRLLVGPWERLPKAGRPPH